MCRDGVTGALLAVLALLLAAAGCQQLDWWSIPRARTSPPPQTFNEFNSFGWRLWWDMAQSDLSRQVEKLKAQGYRLHNLEVYRNVEHHTRFAAIFLKDSRAWYGRWRWRRKAFDKDFSVLRDKGYQPIDLEVINEQGDVRYSAVWIENPGGPGWVMRWGLRHGEFLDELEQWRGKGYRPIDLEVYGFNGKTRYGYVMVHDPGGAGWVARWGKSAEAIDRELASFSRRGYRVVDLEPSYPGGKLQLSAIFVKDGRASDWRLTMSRSSGQIKREINRLGNRYRPIHMAVAPHKEGGMAYLIIWQRN